MTAPTDHDEPMHDDALTDDAPGPLDLRPAPAPATLDDPRFVRRVVEGALLASSQPLTVAQLGALFGEDAPAAPGAIERALAELADGADERGVVLVEVASGWRFQVAADVHGCVARLWTERPQRYTRAALETLALIAYRQPITRGEIEQIRGVAVNSNIIKTLEEREWIRVVGHRDVPGKPALFGTTKAFLDYFGLKSLDALPPLSELRDIGELEPELPFDQAPPKALDAPIGTAALAAPEAGAPAAAEAPAADDEDAKAAARAALAARVAAEFEDGEADEGDDADAFDDGHAADEALADADTDTDTQIPAGGDAAGDDTTAAMAGDTTDPAVTATVPTEEQASPAPAADARPE